jgi:trimethylamine---corrinoid protein Co-methyltransferase
MSIRGIKGGLLKFVSDDDLYAIHIATLEVLSEVGIEMEYIPALEIFKDHGAKVDFKNKRVKIDEWLLNKGLSSVPSTFTLFGKTEDFDVIIDPERVYTMGGAGAINVLDLDGNYRLALYDDVIKLTILLDHMENLHIMQGTVMPSDLEENGVDRMNFAGVFPFTRRNYYSQARTGADCVREHIEMAAVVQGSKDEVRKKPMFTEGVCFVSPLKHGAVNSEIVMECAKNKIPVYIEVDAMPGGTTPAPIAGTLVEQNANVLSGILLGQLVNPGAPCIYATASGLMDMAKGSFSAGAPETNLIHCATAQLAHYYKLPYQGGAGIDTKIPDAQGGYESALQVLSNLLAGTNILISYGMIEMMLTVSYEQIVIDDEIIGASFRILKGFEVNDSTLSVDLLKKIGLKGGHFLDLKETSQYVRYNNWRPKLTNRDTWKNWKISGGKDMRVRANELSRKILSENNEPVILMDQYKEIQKMALSYYKAAVEKYKNSSM